MKRWLLGLIVAAALLSIPAFKVLRELNQNKIAVNQAATQLTCGAGGYSTITVANDNTDAVYLGNSSVTNDSGADPGLPLCFGSCGRSTITVNTSQTQLYAAAAVTGTNVHVLCGW
jgi:hypothetical protein